MTSLSKILISHAVVGSAKWGLFISVGSSKSALICRKFLSMRSLCPAQTMCQMVKIGTSLLLLGHWRMSILEFFGFCHWLTIPMHHWKMWSFSFNYHHPYKLHCYCFDLSMQCFFALTPDTVRNHYYPSHTTYSYSFCY